MPRRTTRQVEAIKREREEDLVTAATPFSGASEDAVLVPPKRKRGRPRKSVGIEPVSTGVDSMPATSASTEELTVCNASVHPLASSLNGTIPPPIHDHAMPDPPVYPAASSSSQPIIPPFEPPLKPSLATMAQVEKPQAKKARKSSTVAESSVGGPSEFRPARIRQKAPQATMQRMERVMSQRMSMMDRARIREGETPAERFAVLGSTGNVYTVIIDHNPTCDCPDCLKGNVPCKHIVFIFLKVLKLPVSSTIWYQKEGLTPSELKHVFEQAPPNPNDPHHVPATVRTAYLKATGRGDEVEEVVEETIVPVKPKREVVGEDCPVCYEEMTEEDVKRSKLVFDESAGGCGNALHSECFSMWAATARAKGDEITCVYCRTPWAGANGATGGKGKAAAGVGGSQYSSLGYLNLADIAGVSRERDTSSYYHGPMAGVRMWQNRYADD